MASFKVSAVGVRVRIDGLDELKRRVEQLNEKTRKKVLGVSAAAGAQVIAKAARASSAFKDQSGDLRKAIKTRRSTRDSKQDYEVRQIGVFKNKTGKYANTARNRRLGRAGKAYSKDPPEYYWRFLEFGTVRMGPKSFLRPAFNSHKSAAAEATVKKLSEKLNEVARETGWVKK